LAHYIRQAKGLSERKDESIQQFGKSVLSELRLLCHWAKAPPGDKQWTDFYSRLIMLLFLYENADDDAGKLARLLLQEMDSLWVFLEENGIEPTNNRAERALRFGVLWRKRSKGTQSNKGDRWVERILSVKQTCRMRSIPLFPVLVNTIDAYFKKLPPDFRWLGYNY
jgi:transposase